MVSVVKMDSKELVELLITHGALTVPQISKLLDANVGSADYHLRKLMEKGIVKKREKSYGSKYYVDDALFALSREVLWGLASTVSLLVFGVFALFVWDVLFTVVCLFLSSLAGTLVITSVASKQRKEKVKALLQAL